MCSPFMYFVAEYIQISAPSARGRYWIEKEHTQKTVREYSGFGGNNTDTDKFTYTVLARKHDNTNQSKKKKKKH